MERMVEFKDVTLAYGRKIIFTDLNLEICRNDFLGIMGPNGAGKTTLLRSMMGLLKPKKGKIIRDRSLRFGYCMQRQFIDTLFPFMVFEMVMMARTSLIGCLRKPDKNDREKVHQALEAVGILHLEKEYFYNLSGGQKQRVLLARALALEPNFLILDEPTTDLDIKAEKEILELIRLLHLQRNLTIVLVTHELNEIINYGQKFIFLNKKLPIGIVNKNNLTKELLSEIFETEINLNEVDGEYLVS